jgi:hypothetical protein
MMNPVQTSLAHADGTKRNLIIEPILEKAGERDLRPTGVFKIFKDAFGDQTHLFTEPAETDKQDSLPDEKNPDYLGAFRFSEDGSWKYAGDLLGETEQAELATFIRQYREPDL